MRSPASLLFIESIRLSPDCERIHELAAAVEDWDDFQRWTEFQKGPALGWTLYHSPALRHSYWSIGPAQFRGALDTTELIGRALALPGEGRGTVARLKPSCRKQSILGFRKAGAAGRWAALRWR